MKNLKLKTNQQGVALAVGMILLLIISIIGITSMKSALLQEKMSAGLKNRELADAAAQSLLVEAEKYLYNYYKDNNAVILGVGDDYIVSPRSTTANLFHTERNLLNGYSLIGASINSQFGGVLKQEPQFIIEATSELASGIGGGATGFTETQAEDEGGAGGANGAGGSGIESRLYTYRVVSKATDQTGYMLSAFESVMTVKVR